MREDISDAKVRGKESVEKLSVSFWDTLNKLQLKTFSTAEKPLKVIQKKTKHLLPFEAQHKVFSRLLTVSKTRPVDLRSAFLYELSGVPLSIFHSTG